MRPESTKVSVLCSTYSGMLKCVQDGLVGSDDQTREGIRSRDVTSVCIIPLHCLDFLFIFKVKAVNETLAATRLLVYNKEENNMKGTLWWTCHSQTLSNKQLDGENQLLKMIRSEGRLDVSTQQAINPLLKNSSSGFQHKRLSVRWVPLYDWIPGAAGSVEISDILYGSTSLPPSEITVLNITLYI